LTGKQRLQGTPTLDDIGFELFRGHSLAVIGSNGAGKSTLLKLITGVIAPTGGEIFRQGTQAALLELGAGFDPDYSGLENLRMNAALLGMSSKEIDRSLEEILEFADIGTAIHEPVRHYSSGMIVRLGFAIVAVLSPDLLITDEVLAVGDESFQKKCIRWIERYLEQGGTLLMVSHNMYQVQKLCRNALWLEGGRVRALGDVFDVTQAYLAWHERRDAESVTRSMGHATAQTYGVKELEIVSSDPGEPRLTMGDELLVRMALHSPDERAPVALVGLVRADGTPIYGVASDHDDVTLCAGSDGSYCLKLRFPDLPLLPGGYVVRAHAMDSEGLRVHDTAEVSFTVTGRSRELGLVRLQHCWEV
jgi:lipopolysaccharide transport system ATP-binding protein